MVQETGLFPHDLLRSAIQLRVVKSTTIAALTLVIWDYFILLPDEIALVWPARWSISKFIFLLNRYLAFTDPILLIYVMMFAEDARVCEITFRALGYLAIVGFNIAQSQ
ncbi:hypothetical protein BD410DRAFT_840544 [Rickenella mellea]|uniref:DUF6533 domain-containing protein n=1 Tax=Rickenella mellea TaxID=50990 RepID=A0A4Y7Q3E8_9AGAM|nr:hypothetical protein BD410DRAFT_840544 [Rickenella mellea]